MPAESNRSTGPLSGLKVIEFTGLGPGPLAGQLLADLGADVVTIDRAPVAPDPTDINRRGKRSIALDLKSEWGVREALELINGADVLIEGFRPGVMEKLGLGPADISPHIVYGRITGWGQDGPLAPRAGHDINYLSLTGALAAIGTPDSPPVPPLNLVADFGGGSLFLLFGILVALYERERSGLGQVVDAAMVDGVSAMMALIHSLRAQGQWRDERASNLIDGGAPFYRCYECADGGAVAVGPIEPQFFAELVRITGIDPSWNQRQYDRSSWAELTETLRSVFLTLPRDEWAQRFVASDACVTPVLTLGEAPDHPHLRARGTFLSDSPFPQAAPAPRFSRTPAIAP